MQHDPLIMKADNLLIRLECKTGIFIDNTIMEAKHKCLQLRHYAVFIVSRVADESTANRCVIAREVGCAVIQQIAKQELWSVVIKIWLIVRPAAIDVIHVKRGCAEVGHCIRVAVLDQRGVWIEGYIVVDKLAEVGVE